MKSFSFSAKDASGKSVNGSINAESPQQFNEIMKERGFTVTHYQENTAGLKKTTYKFKTKDLAFNCRQLAAMLTSGLTLVRALDILCKEQTSEKARNIWRGIYENVQKGETFSDSLDMCDGAFPPLLVSMVGAGETSGAMDVIMQRMSEHYIKENKLNNKVKGAMIYPIVLLVLTVVVVLIMFTFIMPTFADMFDDPDKIPALTKAMLGISTFLRTQWWLLVIIVGGLIFAVSYIMKMPSFRLKWDRFIIKMPNIGKLVTKVYMARFARTMSSLYSSGIPMVECLQRASGILGNSFVTLKFDDVINEVKQGEPLSASIQRADVFDSMFCSIIYVGEESGALDEILEKSSDYYDEEADAAIQRLVSMLEPVMIVIMGVMVGLVVASVLPALYGAMEGMDS